MTRTLAAIEKVGELNEEDVKLLIMALLEGEDRGFSDGELRGWIQTWEKVLVDLALLGLLLRGDIVAKWSRTEDDWVFKHRDPPHDQ